MSKRATAEQFDELHAKLCETLMSQISLYLQGNPCKECGRGPTVPPALLAQIIKFLKDNGINMPASEGNRVDVLARAMPDWSDEDEDHVH